MRRLMTLVLFVGLLSACDASAPVACTSTLPAVEVYVAQEVAVTICFESGELPLSYTVRSSDQGVVLATVEGASRWIRVSGLTVGEAVITVNATDLNGKTAYQSVHVTVPNRAPEILKELKLNVPIWNETRILLPAYVSDPDGHQLAWRIRTDDRRFATLRIEGDTLILIGQGRVKDYGFSVTGTDEESASVRLNAVVNLVDPIVYLTQASHSRDRDGLLVAGRPGLLRLFLTSTVIGLIEAPDVSVTVGDYTERAIIGTSHLPQMIDEGEFDDSYNLHIPGHLIQPGGMIEVAISETDDLSIPRRIEIPLDVRVIRHLDLTLLPVVTGEKREAEGVVAEIIKEGIEDTRMHLIRNALPFKDIVLTGGDPLEADLSGEDDPDVVLLSMIDMKRQLDGIAGHYMGIVSAPLCNSLGNCIGGIAYRPGRASWSVGRNAVMAHELGHNFNLRHAPCGLPNHQTDPNFPNMGGLSGVWGYDFARERLTAPEYPDLMGYCGGEVWISGYNFNRALKYMTLRSAQITQAVRERVLVIWGMVGADGVRLQPAFYAEGIPTVIEPGEHRLMIEATDGSIAANYSFAGNAVADREGTEIFVHLLPLMWDQEISRIMVWTEDGSSDYLDQDTDDPMSIVIIDGKVQSFRRGDHLLSATTFSRGIPRKQGGGR